MIIAPSILNLSEDKYDEKMKEFQNAGIDILHLDIMDGKFVTNITKGVEILEKVNKYPFFFDIHLMVYNPLSYVDDFKNAKANLITFHYEAVEETEVLNTINYIKNHGLKVGISIKPHTRVEKIIPYLGLVDHVLVMSVEPGYGGQAFIEKTYSKIEELNMLRQKNNYHYLIEVDGGVNLANSDLLKRKGTDIGVMGSYLINNNVKMIAEKVKQL